MIFVDHFTIYTWIYLLRHKSDLSSLFPKFKALVEEFFNTPIVTIYSDGGGEYTTLQSLLASYSIQHLKIPPYTPQHNGSAKRRHCHIVEIGLTLLHQTLVPLLYWSYAFLTATYLINRLPTPILCLVSPLEKLFSKQP